MNILDKLSDTSYDADTVATLSYEDGVDVFHILDDHIEDALNQTDTVSALAELVTAVPTVQLEYSDKSVLEEIKDEALLDVDLNDKENFKTALQETMKNTVFDYEWVTFSTEHYDHKRGFTTVEAMVKVNVVDLKNLTEEDLEGWRIEVPTEHGTVILD